MDLNVGEFVRTKNGYIGKIENINDFRPPESKYAIDIQMGDLVFIGEDLITKNSEDIIDLIEVGDYVNGNKILKIFEISKVREGKELFCMGEGGFEGEISYFNEDVQTIVTHEQFKSREYKVGEENE